MNRVDYSRPKVIKNILFHYDDLMVMAKKGDQVSAIVCIDVKRAIHARGVLTFKQRRYLGLWWQGFTLVEIATMYRMDPSVVKRRIDLATGRISGYLEGKRQKTPDFNAS